jgi:hypothetical protein
LTESAFAPRGSDITIYNVFRPIIYTDSTADTGLSLLTDEESFHIGISRCRGGYHLCRYADYWLRAQRTADGGWKETTVAPEEAEVVCEYYPYRTVLLDDYPL